MSEGLDKVGASMYAALRVRVLAVGNRSAEPIMDRDNQVAAIVRMYGCNLNL